MEINRIRIDFGCSHSAASTSGNTVSIQLASPVLGQRSFLEIPLPPGRIIQQSDQFLQDSGDLVFGFLRGRSGISLETATGEMYDQIFERLGSRVPYRIWHFVPHIHSTESGLENYRLFCRARAEAFQRALGATCSEQMPAASAVGTTENEPVFLFIGGKTAPHHTENPEQTPAYQYPPLYGPKSPSFARATRASFGGNPSVFISGTASIKGSQSLHPTDLEKQLTTTLHNLTLVGEASGLGSDLAQNQPGQRHFIVYLRHPENFPCVDSFLKKHLLRASDQCIYLQADICRAELLVEIEATIFTSAANNAATLPGPVSLGQSAENR